MVQCEFNVNTPQQAKINSSWLYEIGGGGRIRTCGYGDQNPAPSTTWLRPCNLW